MNRTARRPLLLVVSLLGLSTAAAGQAPVKRFITPNGQRQTGLFAGVMVGKTLYVAGKGDYRPQENLKGKVDNCLAEIRKTLQLAGMDLEHVVKSFVYLEDPSWYAEFNEHYGRHFPKNPPARTTLGVPQVPGDSRLEITCIAYADLSEVKRIGEPPPGLPFSPGVLAGETLYISGKGDHRADGSHPATFEEQVRQCLHNVKATLDQAGLDFRHVVMSQVFVDQAENLETAGKVYREFFADGSEPAASAAVVDWIPGGSHVEITCIATTDLASRKVVRPDGLKTAGTGGVPRSPAVWAGNTLYLSAMTGAENDSLEDQVRGMAREHVRVLEAAGLGPEDIVAGWVYLRDMADYNGMNAIYREYYSKGPGVRTCLMPSSRVGDDLARVRGWFIAARTR